MLEKARFIQGLFAFEGRGLERPTALGPDASYNVPPDKRAQLIYLRAGNPAPELIYLLVSLNSRPLRYFPVGAKAGLHIPLAIVEDLPPEGRLEVTVGAPEGLRGSVMLDMGLVEI